MCQSCYEKNYTRCSCCNRLIDNDDAYYIHDNDKPYCFDCYNSNVNNAIHEYSYKPSPIFYVEGNLFIGVELEIDDGGECDDNADCIL